MFPAIVVKLFWIYPMIILSWIHLSLLLKTCFVPITSRLNRIYMLFDSPPSTVRLMFTSRHANQQEINQGKDHLCYQSSLWCGKGDFLSWCIQGRFLFCKIWTKNGINKEWIILHFENNIYIYIKWAFILILPIIFYVPRYKMQFHVQNKF